MFWMDLPTIVIRHTRENLKKCSLRGLEERNDFHFLTYPEEMKEIPDLSGYLLLAIDGEPLCPEDRGLGLVLIDSTWRLSEKMLKHPVLQKIPRRKLPQGFRTAYPRRQEDCKDPTAGLASIEALFIAYHCSGRNTEALLDKYYWKNQFLEKNRSILVDSLQ
ncbi:MAG TPA: DTW domain-containing protein [Chlamydiales bacterium]|nr:DTW domain-containing protein [Chlamydiales bacterium]